MCKQKLIQTLCRASAEHCAIPFSHSRLALISHHNSWHPLLHLHVVVVNIQASFSPSITTPTCGRWSWEAFQIGATWHQLKCGFLFSLHFTQINCHSCLLAVLHEAGILHRHLWDELWLLQKSTTSFLLGEYFLSSNTLLLSPAITRSKGQQTLMCQISCTFMVPIYLALILLDIVLPVKELVQHQKPLALKPVIKVTYQTNKNRNHQPWSQLHPAINLPFLIWKGSFSFPPCRRFLIQHVNSAPFLQLRH